jgi:regulation of enolase protein 1 (concanavalin A-like superfamily)
MPIRFLLGLSLSLASTALSQTTDFQWTDVGNPAVPGTTVTVENGFNTSAAGLAIDGQSDQFHFIHQERTGDFDLRVRVARLDYVDPWTKAGLMARVSLAPDSPFAASLTTPSLGGCFHARRRTPGGLVQHSGSFPANHPHTWLRIQRQENFLISYASLDGRSWQELTRSFIELPDTILVGMAASSRHPQDLTTAHFRDYSDVINPQPAHLPPGFEPLGPSSRRTSLVISEIHYQPPPRNDDLDLEFVELFNAQLVPEDISGYSLAGRIQYTFPPGTILPAGAFLVVAKNPDHIRSVYPIQSVIGPYQQSLRHSSGTVELRHRIGGLLLEAAYSNSPPWPIAPDGAGHSLVLARPSHGENNVAAWNASCLRGGSPGTLDPFIPHPLDRILINEFRARSTRPLLDFIELYNHGNVPLDLSGAFLSDRPDANKYQFPPGTTLDPRGFLTLDEEQLGFALNASGETLYLTTPDNARILQAVRFPPQAAGISTGRYPDGAPDLDALVEPTPGAPNSPPLLHDIVINEIMFNPISGDDDDEYLELHNHGQQPADLSHWRLIDGIQFTFPPGTVLPPNGYLVVSRHLDRLLERYPQLSINNTIGNYSGRLSNSGERIALARPNDPASPDQDLIIVDEVTYVDGGRWGVNANRGGSSLELIDPRGDNRRADNWTDSDESNKSDWITIEHTGTLDLGRNPATELHLFLLGRGECLVDDVEVFLQGGPNLVRNSNFQDGLSFWTIQGNHVESTLHPTEGFSGNLSLLLRASGGGDNGANRIKTVLSSAPQPGSILTIRAKARWLSGHTNLLLRLKGNWLEAVGNLPTPSTLGTPGLPNSRRVDNAGPAIFDVNHHPVLPKPGLPVRVTARAHDPDGLQEITLRYRRDPSTDYVEIPMLDDGAGGDDVAGDGLFTALIPPHPQFARVAFHLHATDQAGATNTFPRDAPHREPVIRFGDPLPFGTFASYRIWLTQSVVDEWTQREKLSNHALDATFVYGQYRAIYNINARYRGSPFIRPRYTGPLGELCAYVFDVPRDDRLLGSREFNLDWLEQPSRDNTLQREKASFWIADQLDLPSSHQAYLFLYVNGLRRGSVYTDSQQPNSDYIDSWFPSDQNGEIFKIDDWFEFDASVNREFNVDATLQNFTTSNGSKKQARYRWNWEKKSNHGLDDDYSQLFSLVDALNTSGTDAYTHAVQSIVDVNQWMRIFAVRHIVGDWDGYGYRRGKNQFAYHHPNRGWQMLLWDLDFSLGGGSDGPTHDLYQTSDPTISRMYNHPPFQRAYLRALNDAVHGPLHPDHINPYLNANFEALTANLVGVADPSSISSWVNQRRNYILNHLAPFNTTLAVTSHNESNPDTTNPVISLEGTAPLHILTLTINGFAYPLTWTSVNTWRTSIPLRPGPNTFTVHGFNSRGEPVPDSPPTITITNTASLPFPGPHLVINEWMAANSSTIAKSTDGRYDDWLELHNLGDTEADLTGFTLTDTPANPTRFIVPAGYVIPPGGFLLVWADGMPELNLSSTDLHLNFSLNRDGEFIGLYAPDGTPVDHVTFGPQSDDVSQGRFPDGTTLLHFFFNPTPGAPNTVASPLPFIDPTRSQRRPDGSFALTWHAQPGNTYAVDYKAALSDPYWSRLTEVIADTTLLTVIDATAPHDAHRFYRLQLLPQPHITPNRH